MVYDIFGKVLDNQITEWVTHENWSHGASLL